MVEPEDAGGNALYRIREKIFGGSAELLLGRLVSDRDTPQGELTSMRKLLEELEEG